LNNKEFALIKKNQKSKTNKNVENFDYNFSRFIELRNNELNYNTKISKGEKKNENKNLSQTLNNFYHLLYENAKQTKNFMQNLDIILLNNVQESRILYKKIELIGDLLNSSFEKNKFYEGKVRHLSSENIMLKEVIAEIDLRKKLQDLKNDYKNITKHIKN